MSLLELELACGERLQIHHFSIREAVSSPFLVEIVARSPDPRVDLQALVGSPAALRIPHAHRLWSGICIEASRALPVELDPGEAGLSTYALTIVPPLWLLGQRTDRRVFQHLSIPEIAQAMLDDWGIPVTRRLDPAEHPRLPYRVQHEETDLDCLSRLLEEAGIAYTFSDDDGEHSRLVLTDSLAESAPRRQASLFHVESPTERAPGEHVTRLSLRERLCPDAVTIRDHDFQRPSWVLRGEARASASGALERYSYRPGAFLVDAAAHAGAHAGAEAASHHDDRHGAALAARALQAERAGHCLISFETNAIDLRPGSIITLESHAHPEVDLRGSGLLVTSVSIDGTPNGEWTIQATAVPASEPYRPPRRTPRPRACSVESATVVGPIGQEIHTDEHGRVRVQFPWDRQGRSDERSSCWLRVAQGWAGPGLGQLAVPRVGQEVLVGFLGGDPDQPIIVGRLSNPLNPPPLKLPEEQAHSVWRSASSPGGDGFNEIRLEDGRGAELLSLRAEQDMGINVLRDRAEMIGGDETVRLEGRLVRHTGGDAHVTVAGDQRERIGGTRSLTVDGDQHQRVGGAAALGAGAIHLQTGGALVLEGGDITLRGPGGFLRIDGSGVSIDGTLVHLQSGGAPGEAPGAAPAQPLVPQRVDTRTPGPRRLPLLGFPGLPPLQMPAPGGGGGGPLTPDEAALCGIICGCRDDPSPNTRPSDCVTARIRALEDASGQTTRIMAEVPYDMSTKPPRPIMSRNDPRRPTRRRPADSKIPDVIIRKDPTRPPTQDNIEEVIEIKFPPDRFRRDQLRDYRRIAGKARFEEFGPERCRCPDPKKPSPVKAEEVAAVAAMTVLLIAMLLARQPGPAARLLDKLAPLISRLIPLLTP